MADFAIAVQKTLVNEGGFQEYRNDKGNYYNGVLYGTKYGITAADVAKYYPELISDVNCIRNLTVEQASHIYQEGYWNPLYGEINDQILANKVFDLGVLFGKETVVRLLQITLANSITIVSDGDFGNETLRDVNAATNLLPAFKSTMYNHAMDVVNRNPGDAEFLNDWVRRINS